MSLKDQLFKAGLIDQSKADQADREQRKQTHQKTAKAQKKAKKSGGTIVDEGKVLTDKVRQEQAERSRELNRQQREQAEKKAIQAQIRQLIDMNRIDRKQGEIAYQFADGNKIKKIYLTEKLQDQLAYGMIALVKSGETYELLPKAVAGKIAQRDTSLILVQNTGSTQETAEDGDPYANYQIPDDLMW